MTRTQLYISQMPEVKETPLEVITRKLKARYLGGMATMIKSGLESERNLELVRHLQEQCKVAPSEMKNFLGNDIFQLINTYGYANRLQTGTVQKDS